MQAGALEGGPAARREAERMGAQGGSVARAARGHEARATRPGDGRRRPQGRRERAFSPPPNV
eukprot:490912-Pyramimonas_sp.AAC.1